MLMEYLLPPLPVYVTCDSELPFDMSFSSSSSPAFSLICEYIEMNINELLKKTSSKCVLLEIILMKTTWF